MVSPRALADTLVRRAAARRAHDERARQRVVDRVTAVGPVLRARFDLDSVWLIGSSAWGAFGERSDVDVVVEGARPDDLGAIAFAVVDETGRAADVLAWETLDESFRARIARAGKRVA